MRWRSKSCKWSGIRWYPIRIQRCSTMKNYLKTRRKCSPSFLCTRLAKAQQRFWINKKLPPLKHLPPTSFSNLRLWNKIPITDQLVLNSTSPVIDLSPCIAPQVVKDHVRYTILNSSYLNFACSNLIYFTRKNENSRLKAKSYYRRQIFL